VFYKKAVGPKRDLQQNKKGGLYVQR